MYCNHSSNDLVHVCADASLPTPRLQDRSWVRASHDVEILPGKGVKCWVATAHPQLMPPMPSLAKDDGFWSRGGPVGLEAMAGHGSAAANVRVLVGSRQLLADEGLQIPWYIHSTPPACSVMALHPIWGL